MRQLLLAALLLSVAATSYGGRDLASHPGERDSVLSLYDSSGARVGRVVSYGFMDGVVLTINGAVLFVPVERAQSVGPPQGSSSDSIQYSASRLIWTSAPGVYFAAPNCAGASYMSVSDAFVNFYAPTRPSISVRAGAKVTLYIAADSVSTSTAVGSFFATVLNRCESFEPDSIELWKSESTFDLTGHYPEPLSAHY